MRQKIKQFLKGSANQIFGDLKKNIPTVPERLLDKAIKTSSKYADRHMKDAMMFFKQDDLRNYCITLLKEELIKDRFYLEFGVFKGKSINLFSAKMPDISFNGFDSFEGLQEDWKGWALPKGSFDLQGNMPKVNSNVTLHKGWFNKTVPVFLSENKANKIRFIHIDCDTYESTKYLFETLGDKMDGDTYILFDEYFGYRGWEIGEYKAFQEFVKEKNLTYKYIGFATYNTLVKLNKTVTV
jgi:hypothetical protein